MSRSDTSKAVDKLVDSLNDRRFAPFLFASLLADEGKEVNEMFYQVIISYLNIMATQHSLGIDYFGTQDLARKCHHLVNVGNIDLSPFDSITI